MSEQDKQKIIGDCFILAKLVGKTLAKKLSEAITRFANGLIHFDELYAVYQQVPVFIRRAI